MTKADVEHNFPGGPVERSFYQHSVLLWSKRLVGIIIAVALLHISRSQPYLIWRLSYYVAVAVVLWRMHCAGEPVVYLCKKGLVIKRQPLSTRECLDGWIHEEELFVYVPYQQIIGFTEGWDSLMANNANGGIYMVRVDIQAVSYRNKLIIHERIKAGQQEEH